MLGGSGPKLHATDFTLGRPSGRLRVFIYDLPADFHVSLIQEMNRGSLNISNCDWMSAPCDENVWGGRISGRRQYSAETQILLKFLQAPTVDPTDANLFIVPFLVRTECHLRGQSFRCARSNLTHRLFLDAQKYLPHWSPRTAHQHLFLATGEPHTLPLEIVSQPLVLTMGATWPSSSSHIVVPMSEPHAQLQPGVYEARPRRTFMHYIGTPNNGVRMQILDQIEGFRKRYGRKFRSWECPSYPKIFNCSQLVSSKRTSRAKQFQKQWTAPKTIIAKMRSSVFCVCPPAENPAAGTKRFFDAVGSGCIPVVVSFEGMGGRSWWRPGGSALLNSLPFPEVIDWDALAVVVPYEEVRAGRFLDGIFRLSPEDVMQKQRYLESVRTKLLYDYSGSSLDAFSVLIDTLAKKVWDPPLRQGEVSSGDIDAGTTLSCDIIPRSQRHAEVDGKFDRRWGSDIGERVCVVGRLPFERCLRHVASTRRQTIRSDSGSPWELWVSELHLSTCIEGSTDNISATSSSSQTPFEFDDHFTCWFPPEEGFPDPCHVSLEKPTPFDVPCRAFWRRGRDVVDEGGKDVDQGGEAAQFMPGRGRVCRGRSLWPNAPSASHALQIVTWSCHLDDWMSTANLLPGRGVHLSTFLNVSCHTNHIGDVRPPRLNSDASLRIQKALFGFGASHLLDFRPVPSGVVVFLPPWRWIFKRSLVQSAEAKVSFKTRLHDALELVDPSLGGVKHAAFVSVRRPLGAIPPCLLHSYIFDDVCSELITKDMQKRHAIALVVRANVLVNSNRARWQVASDFRWSFMSNSDAIDLLAALVLGGVENPQRDVVSILWE
eukprot:TRINITY_DN16564_c0_g1_i1.p1 TRINITY_DN16564_c0_g1~~TRINITY_DN16564_c0_g1_i1.p1  ORF type:complete len:867 (+),score=74.10 TRINITY_DN16564_c0_g1_i1:122-2602(+)